jgi:hypothetical protein
MTGRFSCMNPPFIAPTKVVVSDQFAAVNRHRPVQGTGNCRFAGWANHTVSQISS